VVTAGCTGVVLIAPTLLEHSTSGTWCRRDREASIVPHGLNAGCYHKHSIEQNARSRMHVYLSVNLKGVAGLATTDLQTPTAVNLAPLVPAAWRLPTLRRHRVR